MNIELFKQIVTQFLQYLEYEKHLSMHTVRAYQNDLQQLITFWDAGLAHDPQERAFDQIVQRHVLSLFNKKLSKASLARKFSCLRSLQAYAKKENITLPGNFRSPKIERRLPAILSIEEIQHLLDTVPLHELDTKFPLRDKAIFETLYATGVRCAELINIGLDDINFEEQSIKILGKGNKERLVLFGSSAHQAILKYLETERTHLIKDETQKKLFINYGGGALTSRSIQRICQMFRKHLKVDRLLTPHKLRHSFATHLLQQGADLRMVQELLGHATLTSTEIYTQIANKHLIKQCEEKHPLATNPAMMPPKKRSEKQ
jgi:integrase/recombinase XerC